MAQSDRRHFLKSISLGLAGVTLLSHRCSSSRKRPNILFILADDHTTQALSCYGDHLAPYSQTTNIDRLAEEGIKLENCFCTNAICSPSRATILTGLYSHKNGVYCLGQEFDNTQITFPMLFQTGGYQTAVFGKWHLRSRPTGFDDYKVLQVQGQYRNPQFITPDKEELEEIEGWSTDIISDLTIDFIKNRDTDKPFLALCQFKATHDPWDSREPYKSMWRDEIFPEPENLMDDYTNRSQAAKRTTLKLEKINQSTYPHERLENADWKKQRKYIYQQYIKDFIRCGRVLDENVGKLLSFLEQEHLIDDTIIIYTADQGHFLGEHGFFSKRFMYEEAMRMPFLVRYPKKFKPGSINDDMISNADIAPTLLEMANLPIPEHMPGKSFLKNLKGQTPQDWPDAVYYHYWQHILHRDVAAHYGIRTRNRKLIFYYGLPLGLTSYDATEPEWEMFDLEKDPNEMKNVVDSPEYAEDVALLKSKIYQYQKRYEDTDENHPARKHIHDQYW